MISIENVIRRVFNCDFHSNRFLFLVIGWVGVVLLTMQVANAEIKSVTWDPYEILGITEVKHQLAYTYIIKCTKHSQL